MSASHVLVASLATLALAAAYACLWMTAGDEGGWLDKTCDKYHISISLDRLTMRPQRAFDREGKRPEVRPFEDGHQYVDPWARGFPAEGFAWMVCEKGHPAFGPSDRQAACDVLRSVTWWSSHLAAFWLFGVGLLWAGLGALYWHSFKSPSPAAVAVAYGAGIGLLTVGCLGYCFFGMRLKNLPPADGEIPFGGNVYLLIGTLPVCFGTLLSVLLATQPTKGASDRDDPATTIDPTMETYGSTEASA